MRIEASSTRWISAPKSENSGVYSGDTDLRIDDAAGLEPSSHHLGGVYGFIAQRERSRREWQSMDVTLLGRMLATCSIGSVSLICNREIPGITGGALDGAEADPGPLLLQGNHGPVDYRRRGDHAGERRAIALLVGNLAWFAVLFVTHLLHADARRTADGSARCRPGWLS